MRAVSRAHRAPVDGAEAASRMCGPAKTFSATVRSWKTVGSWYIATMPSRCAACGSPIRRGSPSISDLALVGLDDAGQDLHERRLAGAVLADERVHGARVDARLISATAWTPP